MKKKNIYLLVGVIVVAGIGYHFYNQKKERDAVKAAKKKAMAATTQSAATPGYVATGAPSAQPVNQPGQDAMQTM